MDKIQANVEIIRSCDGKVNSHNRIMIAETFGIFSLLNLSKGLLSREVNVIIPIFLTITYAALLVLVFYSLVRSIHYSKVIDLALADISRMSQDNGALKTETISKMREALYDQAQKSCPYPTSKIIELRRKTTNFVYYLAVIAAVSSSILWIIVLLMP